MEDFGKLVLDWLGSNWVWVAVILSVFFEVVPIKLSPLSWIGSLLFKGTNVRFDKLEKDMAERFDKTEKDMAERFDKTEKDIAKLERKQNEIRVACIKRHVLDFANACRRGVGHSKEDFANLMKENGEYEKLVEELEITNDVYTADFEFIKAKYRECQENNSFLA